MAGRFFWMPQSLATWGTRDKSIWVEMQSQEEKIAGGGAGCEGEHLRFLVRGQSRLVTSTMLTQAWQELGQID